MLYYYIIIIYARTNNTNMPTLSTQIVDNVTNKINLDEFHSICTKAVLVNWQNECNTIKYICI